MRSIKAICTSGNRQYETKPFSTFTDVTFDLNPAETSCSFGFECTYSDYGDNYSAKETILIDYSSDPKFLDLACGCTVTYEIQEATIITAPGAEDPLFRKVIVTDSHIHTESGTNITIEY